ncbi:uncharacterized protein LOC131611872 [Vicia villosa]|uniref:uncharacterized protein LOC131611872 n=1 Tax=Vicia villosa TaxID=3911 RepID=UPI00273CF394|nr:uncharacterized protein LOC131611872 [Vicia villosa]
MGNALCGDQFHVILGNHASINMIKDDDDSDDDDSDDDDEDCECWIMRYNIFMTNCTLMLGKFMDDRDRVNVVVLGLTDHICYGQGDAPGPSNKIMSKYSTNNNQSANMAWLGSEISKNQSQPSASHQQLGLTSQPVLDKRNPNFLPNPPQHGPKENKRLQLIDNQDIKGNGNGNNIEGDQKFKISIPFKFVNNFLKM